MAKQKERVEIVEVIENKDGAKVTFSNGLVVSLTDKDLITFTNYGFVSWKKGVPFEIITHGLKKEINPIGTNIFYKI